MRWVPHDRNPADALTKHEGAHVVPLMQFLRTGHYKIQEEAAELESRKQVKSKLGYVPRPRHGHEHEAAKGSGENLVELEEFSPGTPRSLQVLTSGDWSLTEVASADHDSPSRKPRGSQSGSAAHSSATTSSEVVLLVDTTSPDRAEALVAPPAESPLIEEASGQRHTSEPDHVAGPDLT